MTTAFVIRGTTRYHADAACQALDTARLNHGGAVLQTTDTTGHTPCTLCADTNRTEWTVGPANLGELWELIGPSKLHFVADPFTNRVEADGLTILEHDGLPRALAKFGDTITRQPDGTYTVQPAA
ncbi:hypothetical protein ACIGZJ_30915 [Kitasatospora sp. NPDC052868]|uniref:hypothetical protein n=1 Tax=Kitasatospora sp. NPDC052868 TaxID=3364060 RepID=UPI0037C876D2